jgi:hypothetical protein
MLFSPKTEVTGRSLISNDMSPHNDTCFETKLLLSIATPTILREGQVLKLALVSKDGVLDGL